MKLKTKLLPLVGVATACAAVTPIALTSCTKKSDLVDLTKTYTSKYGYHESKTYSYAEAAEEYGNCIKAEPNLFMDDYYWSIANWNKIQVQKNNYTISKNNEKISNFSIRQLKDYNNRSYWALSFTRQFETSLSYTLTQPSYISYDYSFNYSGSIEYKDVPLYVDYYDTDEYVWEFEMDIDWLNDILNNTSTPTNYININFSCDSTITESYYYVPTTTTAHDSVKAIINKVYDYDDFINEYSKGKILEDVYKWVLLSEIWGTYYSHYFWKVLYSGK